MLGLLRRWLAGDDEGRSALPRAAHPARPLSRGLEVLEKRENPASFWWAPVNGISATTPNNWMMGPNTPYARWTTLPDGDDHLYFQAGNGGNSDCVIPVGMLLSTQAPPPPGLPSPPAPSLNTFAGVHLVNGYTHAVQLQGSAAVGTLEVTSGIVRQNDLAAISAFSYAGDLWVTSTLSWSGGTLNDNATAGGITLAGATGLAAPSGTSTTPWAVALGSTIGLITRSGVVSTLDMLSGTYNVGVEDGFVVHNLCSLRLLPDPADNPRPGGGGGGVNPQTYTADVRLSDTNTTKEKNGAITVDTGGRATFEPYQRPATSTAFAVYDAPEGTLTNKGGEVTISDRVQAKFGGLVQTAIVQPNNEKYATSVYQTAGTITLQAGSQILTDSGVVVWAGALVSPTLSPSGAAPEAVIQATSTSAGKYALIIGDSATLDMPNDQFRTFKILGNFLWQGTVRLAISPFVNTQHDLIEVIGFVRIDGTAPKLQLKWAQASDVEMARRAKGTEWIIVTSNQQTEGILGDDKLNAAGSILLPANTQVTMEAQHSTNKKELYARKTSDAVP